MQRNRKPRAIAIAKAADEKRRALVLLCAATLTALTALMIAAL